MLEFATEILKSLSAFPVYQALTAGLFLFVFGPMIVRKGNRDNSTKTNFEGPPQFLLMSPVSDVFGAIHDLAEQNRRTNEILKQLSDTMDDVLLETRKQIQLLDMLQKSNRR